MERDGRSASTGLRIQSCIGQAVSHGCVRMRNADVVKVYERVQVGTPVLVEP